MYLSIGLIYYVPAICVLLILRFCRKSLGGSEPYCPVGLSDGDLHVAGASVGQSVNGGRTLPNQRRARVLCSYDAKDATELNLTGNEVIHYCDFSNQYLLIYLILTYR